MPQSRRDPVPANGSAAPAIVAPDGPAPITFDPALIRGLLRWQTAALKDGRVALVVTLDRPGREPETLQILLHRTVADELGRDVRDIATALYQD